MREMARNVLKLLAWATIPHRQQNALSANANGLKRGMKDKYHGRLSITWAHIEY